VVRARDFSRVSRITRNTTEVACPSHIALSVMSRTGH